MGHHARSATPTHNHRRCQPSPAIAASALYAGVALGASLGGAIVAAGHGATVLCASAAGLELAALFALAGTACLRVAFDH